MGPGRALAQLLADVSPGLLADEQVDQSEVGLVAPRERVRLGSIARAQAALHPRLVGEHQTKAPVHHVVVVHHQHAQAPPVLLIQLLLRRRERHQPSAHGTTRRTCQALGPRGPNSSTPPAWIASTAARRRPMPGRRLTPSTPSLLTSITKLPSAMAVRTATRVGRAWRWALRIAS